MTLCTIILTVLKNLISMDFDGKDFDVQKLMLQKLTEFNSSFGGESGGVSVCCFDRLA